MIGDIIGQFVGEVLCYGTGRLLVTLATPQIRIAKTEPSPWSGKTRRSIFAMTFKRDGSRYYYTETVTFIGMLFWLIIAGAIVAVVMLS